MKAVDFALVRPGSLAQALDALQTPDARAIAGGQSLGPMLNLRLARPGTLVAVADLPELLVVSEEANTITIGAAVTHTAIADGRVPDLPGNILARVAEGIAYRAIRNRGTIGGSLCHADPAADWPCTLMALGAEAVIAGPIGSPIGSEGGSLPRGSSDGSRGGSPRSSRQGSPPDSRIVPLSDFLTGAFRVDLCCGELLQAVRIPRPSNAARWGYYKVCRKPGEFAHAMAAVLSDGATRRGVIGATGGKPILLLDLSAATVDAALQNANPITRQMQAVALRRAMDQAGA